MNENNLVTAEALIGTISDARVVDVSDGIVRLSLNGGAGVVPVSDFLEAPAENDEITVFVEGMTGDIYQCSAIAVGAARVREQIQNAFRTRQKIDVTVVAVEENGLICDVFSTCGFMPRRQIEVSGTVSSLESYLGKTLKAVISKMTNEGTAIVSHRAAIEEEVLKAREAVVSSMAVGREYEAVVTQIMSYGVFADVGAGVEGLVHRSNLSWNNADPSEVCAIGDKIRVSVLSLNDGRISLNHKTFVEDEWTAGIKEIRPGAIFDGKVTSITNFGAFVAIGQYRLEGLVHNSELSWNDDDNVASRKYKLGDSVRVQVIAVDEEKRRIGLSVKRVEDNPWTRAAETYKRGTRTSLPIANIADFGLFLDLGGGIRGLIHKNDISWHPDDSFKTKYKPGDVVECVCLSCDADLEKASFGIKQLQDDPWASFLDSKPLGKSFPVEIKRTTKFGAFAEIVPGVEGLIHISELAPRRVYNVNDVVNPGDRVQATVVTLNAAKRRIGLSLTAQPFEPEDELTPHSLDERSDARIADILPRELHNHAAE